MSNPTSPHVLVINPYRPSLNAYLVALAQHASVTLLMPHSDRRREIPHGIVRAYADFSHPASVLRTLRKQQRH